MSAGLKYFLFFLGILAFVVIVFLVVKKKPENSAPSSGAGSSSPGSSPAPSAAPSLDLNKELKAGSTGAEVKALQKLINDYRSMLVSKSIGYLNRPGLPAGLSVDGSFGSGTESTLYYFTGKKSISLSVAQALYDYVKGGNPPQFWG